MKYGLIGERLGHSFSKDIHALLGNDAYELKPMTREELDAFMKAKDFLGINVTVPYKQAVIPYLDEISPEAKRIGAVNTVVNRDGKLCGYNTDINGFAYLCRCAGIDMAGKKVVIFGSGGTCRTTSEVAHRAGAASISVISRRGADNYTNLEHHADADVVINTTPVGMFPDCFAAPAALDVFSKLSGVADVIYNPLETELVRQARQRGVPAANGLRMLVSQAVYADALFFNKEPDETACEEICRKLLRERRTLVLTGMSGSGKTTLGGETARRLGREFIDVDAYIVEHAGMSIPEIFKRYGEPHFRQLERDTTKTLSAKNGIVIATGGGTVMDEENYNALRKNGMIVLLKRGIEKLEIDGRPMTPDRATLVSLYEKRRPIYEARCDSCVVNDASLSEAAEKIIKLLEEFDR
ncbi:MAG: shikimate kinase [Oscillospiraceae bacterium]|jgi:shikimate dehydrogenase